MTTDLGNTPPPESVDVQATALPADGEMLFGADEVALLTHSLAVSKARDGMVVVRVFGRGETAAHIGTTAERAMRIGARFIQAAMHADPRLIPKVEEFFATARVRSLRVVGDQAAEKGR